VRIFLAVLIWIIFLGGLGFYTQQRERAVPPPVHEENRTAWVRGLSLEVVATFDIAADAFGVKTEGTNPGPSLLAMLGGREIIRETGNIPAGTRIGIEPLTGVLPGLNEIYIEARPPVELDSGALRIRLLRNGVSFAEETFWASSGRLAAGTFRFTLPSPDGKVSHAP
jgi:hypothetical protein